MKYYVVFKGRNPGVYDSWEEVKEQTDGFKDALFKGYSTSEDATRAYRNFTGSEDREELLRLLYPEGKKEKKPGEPKNYLSNPEIDPEAWAVDASCLGNPGKMEYQGVEVKTGKVIFRVGPFEDATNNIGEYLALVHAMALMTQKGEFHNIYSDSKTAQSWVRKKKINTKLTPTSRNQKLFELMARASVWVNTHQFPAHILKWQTELWGEIPADFGRK